MSTPPPSVHRYGTMQDYEPLEIRPEETNRSQFLVKVGITACVVLPFFFGFGAGLIAHGQPWFGSACIILGAVGEVCVIKVFKDRYFRA